MEIIIPWIDLYLYTGWKVALKESRQIRQFEDNEKLTLKNFMTSLNIIMSILFYSRPINAERSISFRTYTSDPIISDVLFKS